jgi:hypothetical protein
MVPFAGSGLQELAQLLHRLALRVRHVEHAVAQEAVAALAVGLLSQRDSFAFFFFDL